MTRSSIPTAQSLHREISPGHGEADAFAERELATRSSVTYVLESSMSEGEIKGKLLTPAQRIGYSEWWIDNRGTKFETLPVLPADPVLEEDE